MNRGRTFALQSSPRKLQLRGVFLSSSWQWERQALDEADYRTLTGARMKPLRLDGAEELCVVPDHFLAVGTAVQRGLAKCLHNLFADVDLLAVKWILSSV